jgi:hypothetical protein
MAVFFRAIWTDSQEGLIDQACNRFRAWVRGKTDDELAATQSDEQTEDGGFEFHLRDQLSENSNAPVVRVVTGTFIEKRPDQSRWTTILRMWQGPAVREETRGADTWFWVDVDAVSHDSLDGVVIGAPRFVRDVIEDGADANSRGVPLTTSPLPFTGEAGTEKLAEYLTDIERDVPVVVFSQLPEWFSGRAAMHAEAMTRAARMVAGLALICTIDESDGAKLGAAIQESYSVWDGAFRIYLPGLDPALSEEYRHRYTILPRYINNAHAAGKLISRAVVLRAGTRRPPDSYESAMRLRDAGVAEKQDTEELLDLALTENKDLTDRIASADQSYLGILDDKQSLETENNWLRHELNGARKQLAKLRKAHPDDVLDIADEPPADVVLPSEAVEKARQYLGDHLDFPEKAAVDLQDIDTCVEARSWGSTSWRAFLALHAYAKELAEGENTGFWTWCKDSKHPLAWPATPKKLAMTESDTVKNNDRLRTKRVFPVDPRVDPSGEVFMEAHIKIAEGGGRLAPRIYFLVSSETKKVHIGYFGPHGNVPNTIA